MQTEDEKFVQRAKIVLAFPNIGIDDLIANKQQILPDVPITVFQTSRYFNDPPSDVGVADRDVITGVAPERMTWEQREAALVRLIEEVGGPLSKPGLVILDDNSVPKIPVVEFLEMEDYDFKLVSPPRTDINVNHMPTYKGAPMTSKWLGKLELLKDSWDAHDLPDRRKLELPAGQHLSDIIREIMAEPIPVPRPAANPDDYPGEEKGGNYITDNRIGSHTRIRAWPLSFSNVIINSPNSLNQSSTRTRPFSRFLSWFFFFSIVFLTVALSYVLYNIVLDYEDLMISEPETKRHILENPESWVEESPFYIWTAWPKKLVRMVLPYAKRRQVSEELLDTVEKWVHTERFLRGSNPGWKFSEVLQRLKEAGYITSDAVKNIAKAAAEKVAENVTDGPDDLG
ncbi:hypothetical protein NHQ30_007902 [Ciborinia camelliae]|nr:hypothetical protein NHQ30_007902 [Ciborinia camelliae]